MKQNDKASDAANQAKEKAKQWLGDKSQQGKQRRGGTGKTAGGLKQAAEHAKDAVREARDAIRNR
jgi:uncharacterized protein YjbJ (UPF0337 family)